MTEKTAIAQLAKDIGYPQEIAADTRSFDFVVDEMVVSCEKINRRIGAELVFRTSLDSNLEISRLAAYAAGRLLREDAILAWDAERKTPVLWKACEVKPHNATERVESFESFCVSCDWWRERAAGETGGSSPSFGSDTMVIMP